MVLCLTAFCRAAEPDVRRDAAVIATEQVLPCVVNIATESVIEYHEWYDDLLRDFYGWSHVPGRQQKSVSLGSGVIIDEDGYVLTNFHVVHRANRIQVKLWDGREFDAEPLVATTGSDVALLKIKCAPGTKFKAIKLATDDDLLLGETVLALGNPFGLGGSVTKGILSSKNRRPSTGNEPLDVQDWLQTDAAINPGNSGGPLVNLRGELIGLNVAVYREQSGERGLGVGFSIPVKQVSAALSRFFSPEVTASLWFGAQLKAGPGPLVVTSVQPRSPAASAELKVGDELLEIDGHKAQSLIGCNRLLSAATNRPAALVVSRGRERANLTVHLKPLGELIRERLGLTLQPVTPQEAQHLGIRSGESLFVEAVEQNSPAGRAHFQRGCLLTAIDGQATGNLLPVAEVLTAKEKDETVRLTAVVPPPPGARLIAFPQTVEVQVR
ncbi:MAG TPA: trypsin-like peptidase domain-containing protein [Candidatus Binatia bacterium]|nr:trypsin-like peptidase domain-containing protein [Candidatus Binatia bacterium]